MASWSTCPQPIDTAQVGKPTCIIVVASSEGKKMTARDGRSGNAGDDGQVLGESDCQIQPRSLLICLNVEYHSWFWLASRKDHKRQKLSAFMISQPSDSPLAYKCPFETRSIGIRGPLSRAVSVLCYFDRKQCIT